MSSKNELHLDMSMQTYDLGKKEHRDIFNSYVPKSRKDIATVWQLYERHAT